MSSFDERVRFIQQAQIIAKQSTCLSRQVGCVLVRDNEVISIGMNDTPTGTTNCGSGGCPRCLLRSRGVIAPGEKREECTCLHAEQVALLGMPTFGKLSDLTMCITIPPCIPCAELIHQYGIETVIFPIPDHEGAGIKRLRQLGVRTITLNP